MSNVEALARVAVAIKSIKLAMEQVLDAGSPRQTLPHTPRPNGVQGFPYQGLL